ncbi:hypothetical protein CEXT_762811 [Caerostris extrusa]|uniref:Ig-like domain-containing protein n=1 Tax=Caerostris extrusa TaxID=172846 RepID=A0AAV4NU48_CAEEX|nr:hypothetical protein CEXT_762811 [Caerostris extrusa]
MKLRSTTFLFPKLESSPVAFNASSFRTNLSATVRRYFLPRLIKFRLGGKKARFAASNDKDNRDNLVEAEPEFAEPIQNVTVATGRDAQLSCTVEKLGHLQASMPNKDSFQEIFNDEFTFVNDYCTYINPKDSSICGGMKRNGIGMQVCRFTRTIGQKGVKVYVADASIRLTELEEFACILGLEISLSTLRGGQIIPIILHIRNRTNWFR